MNEKQREQLATKADTIRKACWTPEALHLHALANEQADNGNLPEARRLWAEARGLLQLSPELDGADFVGALVDAEEEAASMENSERKAAVRIVRQVLGQSGRITELLTNDDSLQLAVEIVAKLDLILANGQRCPVCSR